MSAEVVARATTSALIAGWGGSISPAWGRPGGRSATT